MSHPARPGGSTALQHEGRTRLLYFFALASGAAALTYEVAWTKLLSLSFGSSTLAASAAVAAFMGGMGVGAWLYHRMLRRVVDALRLYAWLEIGIAVSAIVLTGILEVLPTGFAALLSALPAGGGEGSVATFVRLTGVFGLLIVPTALMGATYPALCSVVIGSREGVDRHLGGLYGWNTIGAAGGGLLAGIVLIPWLGLRASIGVGAAINLAVGLAAFALASRDSSRVEPASASEAPEALPSRIPLAAVGLILFASGFATLAYEIVWFRAFRSLAGNSTYAFTIVLVTFLLGLGFGSVGLERVLRRGSPERALAWVQFGIATFASLGMLGLGYFIAGPEGVEFSTTGAWVREMPWQQRLLLHGGIALILMLPATLLMGLSFPLASRLYLGSVSGLSRRIGGAVLLANIGSIAGSIGAAVWLLPNFGSMASTRGIALLNIALGLLAAHFALGSRGERLRWVLVLAGGATLAAGLVPSAIPYQMSALAGIPAHVLFVEEGEIATVRVSAADRDERIRGMSIDGVTIGVSAGWNYPVYSKQILIAHLPMWLEPRIRSVMQIGLGSASTLDALTRHPELERIEAVEISPTVVAASRYFEESRALDDPRVRVHVEDAIHHLLRSSGSYDLIISDGKQNEDFSGNAKMMSREFYELALSRLSSDGLFVQWIPLNNLEADLRAVVRTAGGVFEHLNIFYDPPLSLLFVGSREPLAGRQRADAAVAHRHMGADLSRLGFAAPDLLRFEWLTDREALLDVVGEGPQNTWNDSVIEFTAYRTRRTELGRQGFTASANLAWLLEAENHSHERAPSEFVAASEAQRRAHHLVRQGYRKLLGGDREAAIELVEQGLALAPSDFLTQRARRRLEAPSR